MLLLAASHQPDTIRITIGVILLLVALIGIILTANFLASRSKRERGIPKERRKRKGGRHADHDGES